MARAARWRRATRRCWPGWRSKGRRRGRTWPSCCGRKATRPRPATRCASACSACASTAASWSRAATIAAPGRGRAPRPRRRSDGVLGELQFPDAPALDAWLRGQREQRAGAARHALEREARGARRRRRARRRAAGRRSAAPPRRPERSGASPRDAPALPARRPRRRPARLRPLRAHPQGRGRNAALRRDAGACCGPIEQAHPHTWIAGQALARLGPAAAPADRPRRRAERAGPRLGRRPAVRRHRPGRVGQEPAARRLRRGARRRADPARPARRRQGAAGHARRGWCIAWANAGRRSARRRPTAAS